MALQTSAAVRASLINALRLDLIGPGPDDAAHASEVIPQAPSRWYLSGFLVPYEAKLSDRSDPDSDDSFESEITKGASNSDDEKPPETASARKGHFPSSMGLSFLFAPETKVIDVTVSWGDYEPTEADEAETEAETGLQVTTSRDWQRQPRLAHITIPLDLEEKSTVVPVTNSQGLELVLSVRPITRQCGLPDNTYSASLFLVNKRSPNSERGKRDCAYIFQSQLTVKTAIPFIPRPDLRNQALDDKDERLADLQYRHDVEFVVGHNVSATAKLCKEPSDNSGRPKCSEIYTNWMPQADVEKVIPAEIEGINLEIEALGNAPDAQTIRGMVGGMVTAYISWIAQQRAAAPTTPEQRKQVASELLDGAERVNQRIEAGLNALDNPDVLEVFKTANRAIARAIRQRSTHGKENALPKDMSPPQWRPFQLAFLLMNIVGMDNPEDPDREIVDLLFFPTGGGKTEAYLGLAAFTLVLRRLRNPGIESAGLSVLMRYTLRLLTLDQLGRASTLICALELERQQNVEKLGPWPFEIGLWVGQAATANRMGSSKAKDRNSARARTLAYQNGSSSEVPIPLDNCPWCGERFSAKSFQLLPTPDRPTDLRITCVNRKKRPDGKPKCVFRRDQSLPIVTVDEPIYRRLPCFLIATVDKFANLPWVGETAGLFGKVERYDTQGFYSPAQPNLGASLNKPLLPPDLIIQDELHLISGPLGTMVGLYETAIDALSTTERNGKTIRPKIVASTATVRRANSQILALFGRNTVEVFPSPGPDRRDSFFAKTVPVEERNGRSYLGVAAQGRSLKVVLLRTYLALLGASRKAWEEAGGARNKNNPADPYMTLMGYFNSLRELGGSRRIVEDEVRSRLEVYGDRKREGEEISLFANRKIKEPLELTSRVNTSQVAEAKSRLETTFHHEDAKKAVDVALATNMISVGLDISRLGTMVVLGQPKTASEYIQTTSRVGRDDKRPGLVVTLLNLHRPRDRSHYERFQSWHRTFYRAVEATSVTPFSPRALDRGLPGVTVALARLGHSELTHPEGAGQMTQHRQELDFVVEVLSKRAEAHNVNMDNQQTEALRLKVRGYVKDLLDSWSNVATDLSENLQYQKEVGKAPPLLFTPLDPNLKKQNKDARKFKAQRSLRDVEPTVNLWLHDPNGEEIESDL
ncbi:Helicase conserved C-terminal domain protein [Synechococcus sp. PCC 7335]|uniref:DISARM system helicase DrmA n=1 Tax=Synechococcus sp. (strain ATCC 29403 / PCC 7335) TaxID=91464 RepID=UPI00017EE4A8|nr:DISARM system helicase DrmA [Synechococcus sp. PCC 7335]EDX83177.1 Helicase conserved C-terminal domain protein [Synechococcus sp. PCC 7335]